MRPQRCQRNPTRSWTWMGLPVLTAGLVLSLAAPAFAAVIAWDGVGTDGTCGGGAVAAVSVAVGSESVHLIEQRHSDQFTSSLVQSLVGNHRASRILRSTATLLKPFSGRPKRLRSSSMWRAAFRITSRSLTREPISSSRLIFDEAILVTPPTVGV